MASGQTGRYRLNQWQPEDKVLREEFNGDNSKVDAALADQVAEKAGQADLDGVKAQLATKAAQNTVDNLSIAMTTGLAKKYGTDNPYIQAGNYTGNGAASITITTGFRPSIVFIFYVYPSASSIESGDFIIFLGDSSAQGLISRNSARAVLTGQLEFTDTGFIYKQAEAFSPYFNKAGESFHYIALR